MHNIFMSRNAKSFFYQRYKGNVKRERDRKRERGREREGEGERGG